ncbi:hypothetical protein ACJ72_05363 [Emergomyces africanus]|uniref:Uncharacterized protein n=1 Tax=Emergomyces africanus TaxID=1955775 RepID=A0A1B7NU57_9EURO|nr:hypothetical protein ACJ72_05363 [Emergomyces africanus]
MGSQRLSCLLNDGMSLSQRLMLSHHNWQKRNINLAATCDDIQYTLFFLCSLTYECRDIEGIDCETISVIEDNVFHCRRAIYEFETQVLSMMGHRMLRVATGEEEENEEENEEEKEVGDGKGRVGGGNAEWASSLTFTRWCPSTFYHAVHLALKDVVDELQLVISVAVDVVLLVGDYYDCCDGCDCCDGIGCELPLRTTNGRQRCFDPYPPAERPSGSSDGDWLVDDDDRKLRGRYHEAQDYTAIWWLLPSRLPTRPNKHTVFSDLRDCGDDDDSAGSGDGNDNGRQMTTTAGVPALQLSSNV